MTSSEPMRSALQYDQEFCPRHLIAMEVVEDKLSGRQIARSHSQELVVVGLSFSCNFPILY